MAGLLLLGSLLAASCIQTWSSSQALASNFLSPSTWHSLVRNIPRETPEQVLIPFTAVFAAVLVIQFFLWTGGAVWISRRRGYGTAQAFVRWGMIVGVSFCLLDLWEWGWIAAGMLGLQILSAIPQLWLALWASGVLTTLLVLGSPGSGADGPTNRTWATQCPMRWVWLACGLYIVAFTTMNWRLYFNLLIPHGDSAMYEEHLWNLLHGKGFRSYLDQGLFLGEHLQVVHLFLIPIYVLWPSHLMLELAESTALACGALPVYWMTRRQSGSERMALAAAVAYLLYGPMHFLDIEIDLKTFRPEAFGIPLLLLTLDQLDRRNLGGMLVALAMTMTVKEDFALVFGPLGLWIAWNEWRRSQLATEPGGPRREARWMIAGLSISVGSVLYLFVATRLIMPWFRSGAEIHYVSYFSKFGETPEQIVRTMITQPGLLFGELFSVATLLYAVALLAPLAFLPLFSPSRIAVGMPLFGILCLNELAKDPRHHFHAPLVAILFWALSAGLPVAAHIVQQIARRHSVGEPDPGPNAVGNLLWTSALATGFFFSLGPLGVSFWDPGSSWNWQRLYGPSRRAEMFARIVPDIPRTSRVASTDFVHPRFTHFDRSYDYSDYRRKVSNYEQRVPEDTDYIVIDTQHPYSRIKHPDEVPELRDHADLWELMPDKTEGFFIVLRRRSRVSGTEPQAGP